MALDFPNPTKCLLFHAPSRPMVGDSGNAPPSMSNPSTPPTSARKKCGCGNTKDPQGFCDGSHAHAPAKVERKKCACGKTKDAGGFCDGSHAK